MSYLLTGIKALLAYFHYKKTSKTNFSICYFYRKTDRERKNNISIKHKWFSMIVNQAKKRRTSILISNRFWCVFTRFLFHSNVMYICVSSSNYINVYKWIKKRNTIIHHQCDSNSSDDMSFFLINLFFSLYLNKNIVVVVVGYIKTNLIKGFPFHGSLHSK